MQPLTLSPGHAKCRLHIQKCGALLNAKQSKQHNSRQVSPCLKCFPTQLTRAIEGSGMYVYALLSMLPSDCACRTKMMRSGSTRKSTGVAPLQQRWGKTKMGPSASNHGKMFKACAPMQADKHAKAVDTTSYQCICSWPGACDWKYTPDAKHTSWEATEKLMCFDLEPEDRCSSP